MSLSSRITSPLPSHQERKSIERSEINQQMVVLMEAIAQKDQLSFTKFYDLTNRLVFSLALRILNDRAIAEEITMDVYLQVWRQAESFEQLRGTPLSWLMTIARTRSIDRFRASSHLRQESESLETIVHCAASSESPEEITLYSEQRKIVREALEKLSSEQRVLIEAAYFGGLSHSELAEKFDLPLGTVKTRIRSAMGSLKAHLSAQTSSSHET